MNYLIRRGSFLTPLKICLDKDEVVVGRNNFTELHVSNIVSRDHACFRNHEGNWFVSDLKSTHGTYINGNRIPPSKKTPLKIGDKIGLGIDHGTSDNFFEFELCQEQLEKRRCILLLDSLSKKEKEGKNGSFANKGRYKIKLHSNVYSSETSSDDSSSSNHQTVLADTKSSEATLDHSSENFVGFKVCQEKLKNRRRIELYESSSDEDDNSSKNSAYFSRKKNGDFANKESYKTKLYNNVYSSETSSKKSASSNHQTFNNKKITNKKQAVFADKKSSEATFHDVHSSENFFGFKVCQKKLKNRRRIELYESSSEEDSNSSENSAYFSGKKNWYFANKESSKTKLHNNIYSLETSSEDSSPSNPQTFNKKKITNKKQAVLADKESSETTLHDVHSSENFFGFKICQEKLKKRRRIELYESSSEEDNNSFKNSTYFSGKKNGDFANKENYKTKLNNNIYSSETSSEDSSPSNHQTFNDEKITNKTQAVLAEKKSSEATFHGVHSSENFVGFKVFHKKLKKRRRIELYESSSEDDNNSSKNSAYFSRKKNGDFANKESSKAKLYNTIYFSETSSEESASSNHQKVHIKKNTNKKQVVLSDKKSSQATLGENEISDVEDESSGGEEITGSSQVDKVISTSHYYDYLNFSSQDKPSINNKVGLHQCSDIYFESHEDKSEENYVSLNCDQNNNHQTYGSPLKSIENVQENVDQQKKLICGTVKIEHREGSQCHDYLTSFLSQNIVKTEPESSVIVKSNAEKNPDNGDFGYSQVDEVIQISDDDDLNFSSSQDKPDLTIKVEPLELVDRDFEYHKQVENDMSLRKDHDKNHQNYSSIFGSSIGNEQTGSDNESPSDSETVCSENVESIQAFIDNTMSSSDTANKSEPISNNHCEDVNVNHKDITDPRDVFSVLSKKFVKENEALSENCLSANVNNSDTYENNKIKAQFTKRSKFTSTLLIEPQPMLTKQHSALHKQRRRKELFQDHDEKICDVVSPVKSRTKSNKSGNKKEKITKECKVRPKLGQRNKNINTQKKKVSKEISKFPCNPNDRSVQSDTGATFKKPLSAIRESNNYFYTIKDKENGSFENSLIKQQSQFASRREFPIKDSIETKNKKLGTPQCEFKIPKSVPCKKKGLSPSKISESLEKPLTTIINSEADSVKSTNNSSEFNNKIHSPDTPSTVEKTTILDSKKVEYSNKLKRASSEIQIQAPRIPKCSKRSVNEQISHLSSTSKNNSHITEDRICFVSPNIYQTSSSSIKHSLEKSIQLDFDSVLANILHWNPLWLKEYKTKMKTPPDNIVEGIKCLPLSFSSVDQYVRCFFPFILLELWEYIYKEFYNIQQTGKGKMEINTIRIMVTESISKEDIMVLHCESLISPESLFYLSEGNIIIVEIYDSINKCANKLFGYIFYVNRQSVSSTHLHHLWNQTPESKSNNSLLYKFSIKVKKVKFQVALEKLTKANILCNVANKIHLVNGLQHFSTSELQNCILQPSPRFFIKSAYMNTILPATMSKKYNTNQLTVINSVTEEMKVSHFTPKLLLLQGPPGTGKTHTIIGIILNLLANIKDIKILVTAPSNAAVDLIGRRLTEIKKESKEKDMKIVRVGVNSQIHKDMLPFTLEELSRNHSSKEDYEKLQKLKAELTKQTNFIHDLQKRINLKRKYTSLIDFFYKAETKLMIEKRRKKSLLTKIELIQKKISNQNDSTVYSDKLLVLEEANIVITTLGNCRLKLLETVFAGKSKTRFGCCIVDEAAQCTEPEILQLLTFKVPKLILVGDHKQLPATVYSQIATENKYNVSLFERIQMYFSEKNLPSPIFKLTEQHRMHSEICSFPSARFYSNNLRTSLDLNQKYSKFPLKPFIILNTSQEYVIPSSEKNVLQVEIISEICKRISNKREFHNYSVGIITPYHGQNDLIIRKLKDKHISYPVTVDTINRFQGSEKDLIILSCFGTRGQNDSIGFMECEKRLNVAITRAKQCLIICGHMTSLEEDPVWKALIAHSKRLDRFSTVADFFVNDIFF